MKRARSVDAFAALTGLDEENILLSYFALQQNVPKVIAKINRPEFTGTATRLGIDTIASPMKTIANVAVQYARALENSLGSKVETLYKLMNGNAEALEFKVSADCSIINIPFNGASHQAEYTGCGNNPRQKIDNPDR